MTRLEQAIHAEVLDRYEKALASLDDDREIVHLRLELDVRSLTAPADNAVSVAPDALLTWDDPISPCPLEQTRSELGAGHLRSTGSSGSADAASLAGGVYFCRMTAAGDDGTSYEQTRRFVLIR